MKYSKKTIITEQRVVSLCWDKNDLMDWGAGGIRYHLNGKKSSRIYSMTYLFDKALISATLKVFKYEQF